MTPRQIGLVQSTFKQIAPATDEVATRFYERLWQLDPALRPLFRRDLGAQGHRLMCMLALFIYSLDRPERIFPSLRRLGARHSRYGVHDSDHELVKEALLSALAWALGDRFTPDVRIAWTAAYALLAQAMREGAAAGAAGYRPPT